MQLIRTLPVPEAERQRAQGSHGCIALSVPDAARWIDPLLLGQDGRDAPGGIKDDGFIAGRAGGALDVLGAVGERRTAEVEALMTGVEAAVVDQVAGCVRGDGVWC